MGQIQNGTSSKCYFVGAITFWNEMKKESNKTKKQKDGRFYSSLLSLQHPY